MSENCLLPFGRRLFREKFATDLLFEANIWYVSCSCSTLRQALTDRTVTTYLELIGFYLSFCFSITSNTVRNMLVGWVAIAAVLFQAVPFCAIAA